MSDAEQHVNVGAKRPSSSSERVAFVLLAAGYGTRLARDIRAAPAFACLSNTPKPLLPLGGRVLLDHWGDVIETVPTVTSVVVVTNALHEPKYRAWAETAGGFAHCPVQIVANGSLDNESRPGAVSDMRLGLDAVATSRLQADIAVVIAGDTLLPDLDLPQSLNDFARSSSDVAVFAYHLSDMADCVRRGMLKVANDNTIISLIEKPIRPELSPSSLATAPVYFIRREAWATVADFVALKIKSGASLKKRDAPGLWLAWVLQERKCIALQIKRRIDIGGLEHYKNALIEIANHGDESARHPLEPAIGRALPRVGMLGNPSDGYNGRCIAFTIESEGFAEVIASPATGFSVVPNPVLEMPPSFSSGKACADYIAEHGIHHGARQLIYAGVSAFYEAIKVSKSFCNGSTPSHVDDLLRECRIYYETSIPVCRGLSGSSALILATMRALARFCRTSLWGIDKDQKSWPCRLLRAETELLGIAGGLMDRVAQVYQGCVYMNFASKKSFDVEYIDCDKLPGMWLGYAKDEKPGESSGKVHGSLRSRFESGDPKVTRDIQHIATLADAGRIALLTSKAAELLPDLFAENWRTRLSLTGAENMAAENVRLIECADRAGFVGKMCGSGGAVLCMPKPGCAMADEQLARATILFEEEGFVLKPLKVSPALPWGR